MMHALIITGYTRGIGAALLADLFRRRREGLLPACFVFVGRSEPASADLAAGDVYVPWDLATPLSPAVCRQLGTIVSPHADQGGRLGLLYAAGMLGPLGTGAAAGAPAPANAAPPVTFEAAMNVNATNFVHLAEVVEGRLAAGSRGGLIFHLSSGAALNPYADLPAYCASKAAALMFARCMATRFEASKLCVLSVAPGTVRTAMTQTLAGSDPERFPSLQKFRTLGQQGAFSEPGPIGTKLASLLFDEAAKKWREESHGFYTDLRLSASTTDFMNDES
jgi:NAD(P)-dependent dehydrogenase (short-subunit alcohol dehydrogenase family)